MFDLSVDKLTSRQGDKLTRRFALLVLACFVNNNNRKPNSFVYFDEIKINPSVQFQSARLGFIFSFFYRKFLSKTFLVPFNKLGCLYV